MKKSIAWSIFILGLIAIPTTAYLLYLHYYPVESFCNINAYWNCDTVNSSVYSEIIGIPVALLGLLAYIGIVIWSLLELYWKTWRKSAPVLKAQIFAAGITLCVMFALYLSYIEFFVLKTLCVLCLTQQILIILIMILAYTHLITLKK